MGNLRILPSWEGFEGVENLSYQLAAIILALSTDVFIIVFIVGTLRETLRNPC